MKWPSKRIGEIAEIIMGISPKGSSYNITGEGLPLLNGPTEFGESHPDCTIFTTKSAKEAKIDDLIFCVRGSTTGRMNWADKVYSLGRGVCVIRCANPVDTRFVKYCLDHRLSALLQFAGGTTFPNLSRDTIASFRIPFPECRHQIVSILSAYDDLIENNNRRMALLEESARQLYREWFVRLRFPGHEHSRLVNGVPEGWERKTLDSLCESIDYGYTASAQAERLGPKLLRITDIVPTNIDWSSVPFCEIADGRKEKFSLKEGDIVIARTGATVGYAKRLHKRHPDAVFASYLVRLRIRPEIDNLLIGIFVESEDYKAFVKSNVGGAAQPNANAKVLASATLLLPSRTLQQHFRSFVEPLFDERELLQLQNQKLKAARDLLLPRLMNGELAV